MKLLKYIGAVIAGVFGGLSTIRGLELLILGGDLPRALIQTALGILFLALAVKAIQSARARKIVDV